MCKQDTTFYIISNRESLSNIKPKILSKVAETDFEELQYTLNKSFDRHGMDAKEVAMSLIIAGYGKIITLQNKCDKLVDDNKALQSNLDMYILECLSLRRQLEELKNENSQNIHGEKAKRHRRSFIGKHNNRQRLLFYS